MKTKVTYMINYTTAELLDKIQDRINEKAKVKVRKNEIIEYLICLAYQKNLTKGMKVF